MIVSRSEMAFAVCHQSVEKDERRTSIRMWADAGGAGSENARPAGKSAPSSEEDRVTLSNGCTTGQSCPLPPKLEIIRLIVERMTGRTVNILQPDEGAGEASGEVPEEASGQEEANAPLGWGMEIETFESRYEAEETAFAASGTIRTAGGREIRFALKLEMSRIWYEESSTTIRLGDAARVDPLVINFNGGAADLSDVRFSFDLDSDGTEESMAALGSGSGYLVLDRNGDGSATDGGELFGPATGRGFQELSACDEDGNGWIDENDDAYRNLRIWIGAGREGAGLTSLADAGVEAISLENLETPFDLRDRSNGLLGSVRSTGVYVGNDGAVGTLQQIDLAV